MDVGAVNALTIRRSSIMQAVTTIGLDIAKSVFQVHGVDAEGSVGDKNALSGHSSPTFRRSRAHYPRISGQGR
jgi:hypothetical protein